MALKTLAQQATWDTENIHFNSETGFGVLTDINGKTINAELSEVESEGAGSAAILKEMELRVLASELVTPKPTSSMKVNGVPWIVSASSVVEGELIVILHRHRS